ncbi:MAG: DUF2924 domain-containing protein [Pseudomonadota bacterium]
MSVPACGFDRVVNRSYLTKRWEVAFGAPPPPYVSLRLMRKALAYEEQSRTFGGLSDDLRRKLRAIVGDKGTTADTSARSLSVGAQLVREWNGRTYRVEVTEEGFRMDDRIYPSLSAVARRITGTNWSGPRFFGLRRRSGALR